MEWAQVLTFLGINVTILGILSGLMIYFFSKIDNHMSKIEGRLNSHSARIDQLYSIIVDLLKGAK